MVQDPIRIIRQTVNKPFFGISDYKYLIFRIYKSLVFQRFVKSQYVCFPIPIVSFDTIRTQLAFSGFSSARCKLSSEIICSYKLLNLFIFFVFRTQSLRFPYQHLYELCYLLPIGKVVASYVEFILKIIAES